MVFRALRTDNQLIRWIRGSCSFSFLLSSPPELILPNPSPYCADNRKLLNSAPARMLPPQSNLLCLFSPWSGSPSLNGVSSSHLMSDSVLVVTPAMVVWTLCSYLLHQTRKVGADTTKQSCVCADRILPTKFNGTSMYWGLVVYFL